MLVNYGEKEVGKSLGKFRYEDEYETTQNFVKNKQRKKETVEFRKNRQRSRDEDFGFDNAKPARRK